MHHLDKSRIIKFVLKPYEISVGYKSICQSFKYILNCFLLKLVEYFFQYSHYKHQPHTFFKSIIQDDN